MSLALPTAWICFESIFHHNKDWNGPNSQLLNWDTGFESIFHNNKDWNELHPEVYQAVLAFESIFHHNKDWNPLHHPSITIMKSFESIFHHNKDWNTLTTSPTWWTPSSRASSTTTRIETLTAQSPIFERISSRASSTTTRIETSWSLRLLQYPLIFESIFHQNKDWNLSASRIRISCALREHLPSEQGLKPDVISTCEHWPETSRASSIRTRIETILNDKVKSGKKLFESIFHQNKDWNTESTDME